MVGALVVGALVVGGLGVARVVVVVVAGALVVAGGVGVGLGAGLGDAPEEVQELPDATGQELKQSSKEACRSIRYLNPKSM